LELEEKNRVLQNYQNNLEELVQERTFELHQSLEELAVLNKKLEELSHVDGLTGLANRRLFDQTLSLEYKRLAREKQPLSLIMIDVDDFKKYNDTYGHLQGDKLLVDIAKHIRKNIRRATDLAARYGGEEFSVIMPNTDIGGALYIAEKIRSSAASKRTGNKKQATISLGVVSMIPTTQGKYKKLVKLADSLLYEAKKSGKNCVKCKRVK
jgi:diguanylate cyclase (GGDEF)-like protein